MQASKLTIVINGRGGVGKDTLCDFAAERYCVRNVSSITPIKEIARTYGWNGEKDLRSRKFLSDLKRVFTEYNDLPTQYLLKEHQAFTQNEDEQILFVHIRESDQISAFVRGVDGDCITLLVRREDEALAQSYGNASDDDVENYPYDHYYDNNLPLDQTKDAFIAFLQDIASRHGVCLK